MRKQPTTQPPPVGKRPDERFITQTRQYKLITPIFGGGVTPAEADPVTVIRGPEVRGHLRFWWRACRGGRFNGNLRAMKRDEDLLWGASSTEAKLMPSQVHLTVAVDSEGALDRPLESTRGRRDKRETGARAVSLVPYAAFPLQPNQAVRLGVSFTLIISFPKEHQTDLEAAMWAWETFGGLGARTRRGFGALCCTHIDGLPVPLPEQMQIDGSIRQGLEKHVTSGEWPDGVPHLSRKIQFKARPGTDTPTVWQDLILKLKKFRQARNPGSGRPGRSQWPEPDAIRRLTGRGARQHKEALSDIDKFPRAAFGLPIIFHFKDTGAGDPSDTTLKGASSERLASPLILRPIACANNRAVGLALILVAPQMPPEGLVLENAPGNPQVSADLTLAEAKRIKPLNGQTDILWAFLETL